jgi:hypothetical protein
MAVESIHVTFNALNYFSDYGINLFATGEPATDYEGFGISFSDCLCSAIYVLDKFRYGSTPVFMAWVIGLIPYLKPDSIVFEQRPDLIAEGPPVIPITRNTILNQISRRGIEIGRIPPRTK